MRKIVENDPTPDEIENDPEIRAILSEIYDDEDFLIRDQDGDDDEFDQDDDEDDSEDVCDRLGHSRTGAWDDEEYN